MPLSGIGIGEMMVIAMLVLIVFGPHRLPEITRQLGKAMREFKRGMNEIQREMDVADREQRWGRSGTVAAGAASASSPSGSGAQGTDGETVEPETSASAGSTAAPEPTIAPPVFGSDLPDEIESQIAPPPEATAVRPPAPAAIDGDEVPAETPAEEPEDVDRRQGAEGFSGAESAAVEDAPPEDPPAPPEEPPAP